MDDRSIEPVYSDDLRLVRFLTFADAKRVLSDYSTFCLCSTLYYWQQELENPDSTIGDTHENRMEFVEYGRVTKKTELGAATLLSCWTILERESTVADDWALYRDRKDGIAIISTASRVRALLTHLAKDVLDSWSRGDGKIIYHDGFVANYDTMQAWRYKRKKYESQREYRFAFLTGSPAAKIQFVTFYVEHPQNYIDSIHFGPETTRAQKGELLAGAIAAEVAGRIFDFHRHFASAEQDHDGDL
jgi:hypothetical protein